jgi:spermidine/putrescine transport system permease protein
MLFELLPFGLVIVGSFLLSGEQQFFSSTLTLQNYQNLMHPMYLIVFLRSFTLAAVTAILCLWLGYPFAYILVRLTPRLRGILIFLMIIPFWTNALIRLYAIIIIIRGQGLLNHLLLWLGVIHQPLHILYTQSAVLLGLVYTLLPFMVLPIYANLEKFDWNLLEAARDLGAGRWRTMFRVVIPLSMPGIVAGTILVLLPSMALIFVPDILGNAKSLLLGNLIENQFVEAHNWPLGSAASTLLTLIMGLMLVVYWKISDKKDRRDLV